MKAVPIMLTGYPRNYFENSVKNCAYYDEVTSLLRHCYNSEDKKYRILTKW